MLCADVRTLSPNLHGALTRAWGSSVGSCAAGLPRYRRRRWDLFVGGFFYVSEGAVARNEATPAALVLLTRDERESVRRTALATLRQR
jgi:hypothetical protein